MTELETRKAQANAAYLKELSTLNLEYEWRNVAPALPEGWKYLFTTSNLYGSEGHIWPHPGSPVEKKNCDPEIVLGIIEELLRTFPPVELERQKGTYLSFCPEDQEDPNGKSREIRAIAPVEVNTSRLFGYSTTRLGFAWYSDHVFERGQKPRRIMVSVSLSNDSWGKGLPVEYRYRTSTIRGQTFLVRDSVNVYMSDAMKRGLDPFFAHMQRWATGGGNALPNCTIYWDRSSDTPLKQALSIVRHVCGLYVKEGG